jgi:hypothetical protein
MRRELHRQVNVRLLGMQQLLRRSNRIADMQRRSSQAGGKVTPEPPSLATRAKPSAQPVATHRYR